YFIYYIFKNSLFFTKQRRK
ncbi:putative DNA topoisomerase, partial [Serratia symbiotica str. Tucson]